MTVARDWRPTRAQARQLVVDEDAFLRPRIRALRSRPPLTEAEIETRLVDASGRHAFWRDPETLRPIEEALAGASMAQILVYAVPLSHADICNGGFHQYFWNYTGDYAGCTVAGLRVIGEDARADLIVRAMSRFPGAVAPSDQEERRALLHDVDGWRQRFRPLEVAYYALDGALLDARVRAYADAHPHELFRDG